MSHMTNNKEWYTKAAKQLRFMYLHEEDEFVYQA